MKKSMLESAVDAVLYGLIDGKKIVGVNESKKPRKRINEGQNQDLYMFLIDHDGNELYQESNYTTLEKMISNAQDYVDMNDAIGFTIKSSETGGDEDIIYTS